jgi:hypothetical protein
MLIQEEIFTNRQGDQNMNEATTQIVNMFEMLPKEEQQFAYEMLKRIVLAWDPDFSKMTFSENENYELGLKQVISGECLFDDEIDWEHIEKYV